MTPELSNIHNDYLYSSLDESNIDESPIHQFHRWLSEAIENNEKEPAAMVLSTVSGEGKPSSRVVLLKEAGEDGFSFFTNYCSRKGKELELNPFACLLFYWPNIERQVRIEGKVEKIPDSEADKYFSSRPLGSKLSAWASPQSQVIENRYQLESLFHEEKLRFSGDDVPRPPFWGGFRLSPECIEFWQGRENRLHDRLQYLKKADGWKIVRLAP